MHKHSLKGGWGASMSEVDITKRHPQLAASTLTGRTTVTHNTEMSKMFPQWQSKHPRDLISARASHYHWKTSLSRQRLHREDTHSHTHTHAQASSFYAQQLSKNAKNWPFLAQRAKCLPLETAATTQAKETHWQQQEKCTCWVIRTQPSCHLLH